MAVMLYMTDPADGYFFTTHSPLHILPPYNQALALTISTVLLWHVSCGISYCRTCTLLCILLGGTHGRKHRKKDADPKSMEFKDV